MKGNSVGWFEIYVNDMKRAKGFYENVFGQKLSPLNSTTPNSTTGNNNTNHSEMEMWAFPGEMSSYGAPGALVKMQGLNAGKNSVLVYFSCNDCQVEEKKVLSSGGKVEKPKFSIGQYGYISLVYDTEGNMIGLHSMQ